MSSVDLNCLKAEKLAENGIYKLIIIVKTAANAASVVLLLFYALTKGRTAIFHPNTRIIYQFICASLFLATLHTTFIYFYEIYRLYIFTTNPCDRLWSTSIFFYLRNAVGNFLNGVNSSLIVLCIERGICIWKIASYEESSRPILVVILLIFLTALSSIAFFFLSIHGVNIAGGLPIASLRNEVNSDMYQMRYLFVVTTEVLSVIFFLFIHYWALYNRKKIRGFRSVGKRLDSLTAATNRTLSVKFQIEETLKITALFLPMVVTKCFIQIFSHLAARTANFLWPNLPIDTAMIVYELANIWLIQSFPCALLLLYGSGRLSRLLCCSITDSNRLVPVTQSSNNQAEYFDRLKNIFEKDAP